MDQTRKTIGTDLYRAWFPRGQTPTIQTSDSRKGVNLLGAVSDRGETRFYRCAGSFTGAVTVRFLAALRWEFGEHLLVILDNASYFTAGAVKEFVAETAMELLYLPVGSPDLNPAEECWRQFHQALGNRYFGDKHELLTAIWPTLNNLSPPDPDPYLMPKDYESLSPI